jgi:hypothetical protein
MAEVCAVAEEKKHRLAEIIDWARRLHWIWTLFPADWKVFLVGAAVAAIVAILSMIRRIPLPLLFIYSLLALVLYIVGWVIVQKWVRAKPFFSLEAFSGEIHDSDPPGTPYFFIRNCGERTPSRLLKNYS